MNYCKLFRTVSALFLLCFISIAAQGQTESAGPFYCEGQQYFVDLRHINWSDLKGIQPSRTAMTRGDGAGLKWIDRIGNMPDYLIDFYHDYGTKVKDVLNGNPNWLSDPTLGVYDSYYDRYDVIIKTFSGSVDFTFPVGSSDSEIASKASEAVMAECNSIGNEFSCFFSYLSLCLNYDYPEAFWTGNGFRWGSGWGYRYSWDSSAGTGSATYEMNVYMTLKQGDFDYRISGFQTQQQISDGVTEFNAKVESVTGPFVGKNRYEQVAGLNDWLTTHNSYNTDLLQTGDADPIAWSSLSALRESTGALGPVCEGYSRAFKCLCEKLDIPCIVAIGDAKSSASDPGGAHMWNEVQMDDSKWYAVDVTWNDPTCEDVKASGCENQSWLLLGKKDEVAPGFTFEESHPNTPAGNNNNQDQWELLFTSLIEDYHYQPGSNPGGDDEPEVPELNDGDWFMGKTAEGLDMNFRVISAKDKTCMVAAKQFDKIFHAIDTSTEGPVTIPAEVNGFKVIAIDDMAFYYCGGVTSFSMPEGLITIGAEAFEKCGSVKSFTIPSTVTTIKGGAFYNCLFESITIPKSVTSIGGEIFFWCNKLKTVVVEDGNPVYDSRDNCNGIIETATNKLVATCPATTIPKSVTVIGEYACGGNDILCSNLPEGIEIIENRAFHRYASESIILPSTIKSMGAELFVDEYRSCESLTSVTVKSAAPCKINDKTFINCPNLTTLYVPVGSKDAYAAADYWKEFKEILEVAVEDEVVYIPNEEEKTVAVETSDKSAKEVEIQSEVEINGEKYEVTAIGDGAFENNENLEKVSIPETIDAIGDNAFAGCTNLKEIRVFATEPIQLGSAAAGTRGSGASSVFAEVDMETCVLYVPAGSKEKYEQADGWKDFKNIVEMGESVAITIGGKGKATFTGKVSLDFSFSDEVKAYVATGIDKESGTIWLTRVKDVPAGVPVMIKGEANKTYNVPVKETKDSYYKNMFVGNTSGATITIAETSDDGTMTNYYMSDGQFKSVKTSAKIGDGKCYLQLPTTLPAAAPGANQPVTIAGTGKSSYAAPVDLDFTNVDGLKAFTATGYDRSSKTIWLTRVMKAQKGEGLLLKGDANQTYNIPSAGVQSGYGNMFVGNTSGEAITIYETNDDGRLTNFYLTGGQFKSVTNYATINNNRCYLQLPTEMVSGGASTRGVESGYNVEEPEVISMPIVIKSLTDADGMTGIDEVVKYERQSDDAFYNLQGQRVDNPGKGLYIRNGKKIIIR